MALSLGLEPRFFLPMAARSATVVLAICFGLTILSHSAPHIQTLHKSAIRYCLHY
ncbi:hypothetical protein COCCADRAFT_87143 [Bipolaris zeicola 26-R-13]|uniref:Uncharacterized protein n=1 Tax=Cochliobolus carbonum (strain 26-R-13) TaxID=930089 RepID=W6YH87_COCC2|nr:uncharacterized protein COCCADRAFT_87143 [Bipolaris zeicola 26-R-13]EUC36880.1 hypothetical protein COCCADRAFT_87143 [Bipolaris zeicola 26-R-13]